MMNIDECAENSQNGFKRKAPKFLAFGNVLLDYSVQIYTDELLQRYGLGANETRECSLDKLNTIINEIKQSYQIVQTSPGGSALNTCKILRSLDENEVIFFSCIGNDNNGNILQSMLSDQGIETCLQVDSNQPTGICICLIYKLERCCIANIGASNYITKDFLGSHLNSLLINNTVNNEMIRHYFYIEGFFVSNSNRFNLCKYIIAEYYTTYNENVLILNLSANYIVKENPDKIQYLLKYSDIVFGNRDEYETLAKILKFESMENISIILSENHIFNKKNKKKMLIITDGNKPVEVIYNDKHNGPVITIYEDIPFIPNDEIIDTTGAGDAFVAGFMYNYMREKSIRLCVKKGIEVATKKLKKIGGRVN